MKRLLGGDASIDAHGFRLRGREVSRLEALSDAVFGFAITLLVVSLEVPRSFDELMTMMTGFVSFGICFAMLLMIWYTHFVFFVRYGLRDFTTVILNSILLFVVVFYIYPLKFMFTLLDALVRHITITSILYCVVWMSVGLLSMALAAFGGQRLVALAGLSFSLLGPLQALNGSLRFRSSPKRLADGELAAAA